MKKTVWTFGLISGAILSVMMAATIPFENSIGYDRGLVIGYTTMVLAGLLIYFGIRSYRDTVAGGVVSFWRALTIGALVTAISSVCYTATWEVIYYRFMPDFATKYATHELDKAKAAGATPAQLDQKAEEMKKFQRMYANPAMNAAMTFIEPLPVGLLITLVAAAILSRKPRRASGDSELPSRQSPARTP